MAVAGGLPPLPLRLEVLCIVGFSLGLVAILEDICAGVTGALQVVLGKEQFHFGMGNPGSSALDSGATASFDFGTIAHCTALRYMSLCSMQYNAEASRISRTMSRHTDWREAFVSSAPS